jgi:hypothetical protein
MDHRTYLTRFNNRENYVQYIISRGKLLPQRHQHGWPQGGETNNSRKLLSLSRERKVGGHPLVNTMQQHMLPIQNMILYMKNTV